MTEITLFRCPPDLLGRIRAAALGEQRFGDEAHRAASEILRDMEEHQMSRPRQELVFHGADVLAEALVEARLLVGGPRAQGQARVALQHQGNSPLQWPIDGRLDGLLDALLTPRSARLYRLAHVLTYKESPVFKGSKLPFDPRAEHPTDPFVAWGAALRYWAECAEYGHRATGTWRSSWA
ncbi:MAG: hypothetical protein AAGN46_05600 [Acidobacteriota bacterium]